MAIEIKENTPEQDVQDMTAQQEKQGKLAQKIMDTNVFKSLDLPNEEPVSKQEQPQEAQETQEEVAEEPVAEAEDSDEELIPKSKIQPRIDKATSEALYWKNKYQSEIEAAKPKDETQSQLEKMSESELEDTLVQVRMAMRKAGDDDAQLSKLVKLERDIEKTISQAPVRFVREQERHYQEAAREIVSDPELPQDEETGKKILNAARTIYQKYGKLQKDVEGQAIALKLAAEHIKELSSLTKGTQDNSKLKSQLNTLKRKTSLDTKVLKGTSDNVRLDKLRQNASTGTIKDKVALIKEDPRFKIDLMSTLPEGIR